MKMINLIDPIVKNIIQMGLNFISSMSLENIACVGQETIRFGKKKVPRRPTQNCLNKTSLAPVKLISNRLITSQ